MHERDIFIAALERTSNAVRAAYLDEACGCGGALRDSVEALLREHTRLGNLGVTGSCRLKGGAKW